MHAAASESRVQAPDLGELRLEPSLEEARELAREGNVVPVRSRLVDDCETPVSAFLKLGAGEPHRVVHEALPALERTLKSRAAERPEGSYTVQLLDNPTLIGEKVEEEAEEVVRAAREETDERVAEEAADVLYHLAVLLAARGVPQAAVFEELNRRAG